MDISPFDATRSFVIYLEPLLNTFHKTYQTVITLSIVPNGPIRNMVKPISAPKLSPFQMANSVDVPYRCTNVLMRFPNTSQMNAYDCYMGEEDIPSVISYLRENQYVVDTDITDILYKSGMMNVNNKRMICSVRYNAV